MQRQSRGRMQPFRFSPSRRIALAVLLLTAVASCSMAGLAYDFAPGMAVRYADDYLDLDREQERKAKSLFEERLSQHARDELPRYHELLQQADATIGDGVDREDVDAVFDEVRALYRLGMKRTVPAVAAILADVAERQVDVLAERLAREAEEDREEIDEDHEGRELADTLEDIEEWVGPLNDAQHRLVTRKLRDLEATRPFWLEWRIAKNERLVELLRGQPSRAEIETFLTGYWVERTNMPRYLEEALESNGNIYREMIVALDDSLTPEQREKARERVAEFRGMVLDMMPREVRLAVLENGGSSARGHAGQ